MAIAAVAGTSKNSSVAVSSLAMTSVTTVTGEDVLIGVVLGSTSVSVSSISKSAGTYTGDTLLTSLNAGGIRIELWKTHAAAGAATVFTVNLTGGTTTIAVALERYSGISSFGNVHSISGSNAAVFDNVQTQDAVNFVVGVIGFSCQSGDTLTAKSGTSRQSSIPAATAVGVALYDSSSILIGKVPLQSQISTARAWSIGLAELRSGGAANAAAPYAATVAASMQTNRYSFFNPVQGNTAVIS
jgi:hypothetical protein